MASEVAFVEKFVGVSFSSFTAFEKTLNQYMKDNFVIFVRSSSNRSTNTILRYEWVYYKCSRRPPRKTESHSVIPTLSDVVNVDGTHATNRFGYKLYTFLITDGMGTARPVMYAFVESEQFAPMRKLFGLFKEMMGEAYPVRTFVMDKLAAQMRGARVVFGCDIMLCYFHVRKAIRKHKLKYSGAMTVWHCFSQFHSTLATMPFPFFTVLYHPIVPLPATTKKRALYSD
ncbi:hypothetical protein T265_02299 [Opisthorchis viverrini]|uniref:ZSWIM1/3 RNaseH-like domain-containing protein n=1 Tax=Opisthorchis viverrini TaxID=6198 RepID=A0A074ZZT7_OPIVI|nr:hypothetical protein T265_02299 [Opisthorchis viverrini]KER31532.1 hypothetical protein T265_02299 [Opisthorchis viverrini]